MRASTKELNASIEKLYATFARYPLRASMDACPCCVTDEDMGRLCSKELRGLEENDISLYAYKAMTTWGDVEDFKHFLPRIFELASASGFVVDTAVLLGKLEYGNWSDWPENEQMAIKEILIAWWADLIQHQEYFDDDVFRGVYKLLGNVKLLLDKWSISFEDNSFRTYVDFVNTQYDALCAGKQSFKELDNDSREAVLSWIKHNKGMLEEGFFFFEKDEPSFAEAVSNALYILEHI
jgi:hypothetical protein